MNSAWRSLGRIYDPTQGEGNPSLKDFSHAAYPVPWNHQGGLRLFYSRRDANNRSHIFYSDWVIEAGEHDPVQLSLLAHNPRPVFSPGDRGAFDDCGVNPGCLVLWNGRLFLFYLGWTLTQRAPWSNWIGLAAWNDQQQVFERLSRAPILGRHDLDPFSLSYPMVLADNEGFTMYYGSHKAWGREGLEMIHQLRCAQSTDLQNWRRDERPLLPFATEDEYALSRPWVVKDPNKYVMWFSYQRRCQQGLYRIGQAQSTDGYSWARVDCQPNFSEFQSHWSNEMQGYASVIDVGDRRFLFYNGNGYGKTGIGALVSEP